MNNVVHSNRMKKLFPILFISLFIFSCDSNSNPTGPLSCDEGLTELNGECVDQCGVINGDNTNQCGSCSEYVYLWTNCYSTDETVTLDSEDQAMN